MFARISVFRRLSFMLVGEGSPRYSAMDLDKWDSRHCLDTGTLSWNGPASVVACKQLTRQLPEGGRASGKQRHARLSDFENRRGQLPNV